MLNKKKFKRGIQKIVIAISLAFIGPVIFVLSTNNTPNTTQLSLNILGIILMIGCIIIGAIGIKELVVSFSDKSNE